MSVAIEISLCALFMLFVWFRWN